MTKKPDHHQTKDGSSTLYSNQFNQFYHNPNGAVSESLHVFFDTSGLAEALTKNESITILEVGFGTGLNFLLLLDALKDLKSGSHITYYSIEGFPISQSKARQLNYGEYLKHPELAEILPDIFSKLTPGINTFKPFDSPEVELSLFFGTFDTFEVPETKADFIFHDAFSPEVNQELWTVEAFQKLKESSKNSAVLSTYCAASKARAAMATAGWLVARAPGALGKREMSVASPDAEKLSNFKRVNEKRLIQRMKDGDFE